MTGADAPLIAIAVLAAGSSTRLGRPKQLVPWRGGTLLHHAANVAIEAALGPVLVVLGAHADRCAPAVNGLHVGIIRCRGWREGMGASIRAAVAATEARTEVGALIVTACDQPDVTPDDLQRLAQEYRKGGAAAVAAAYDGVVGVPALFGRAMFPLLAGLKGDRGAREVLRSAGERLRSVPCPAAAFDVDAESDLAGLP